MGLECTGIDGKTGVLCLDGVGVGVTPASRFGDSLKRNIIVWGTCGAAIVRFPEVKPFLGTSLQLATLSARMFPNQVVMAQPSRLLSSARGVLSRGSCAEEFGNSMTCPHPELARSKSVRATCFSISGTLAETL